MSSYPSRQAIINALSKFAELNRPISTMGAGSVWRDNGKYIQKNSILPQANGNKIYVKPQKLNGHSIDNFIFK